MSAAASRRACLTRRYVRSSAAPLVVKPTRGEPFHDAVPSHCFIHCSVGWVVPGDLHSTQRPDGDLDLLIDYDPETKTTFRLMQIEEEISPAHSGYNYHEGRTSLDEG
jgi:hypothetical protein